MDEDVGTARADGPATGADKMGMVPEVSESDGWYREEGERRVARSSVEESWSLRMSERELVVLMVVTPPACAKRPVARLLSIIALILS
jgi:hypothetical protein